jgi:hypothetical protein
MTMITGTVMTSISSERNAEEGSTSGSSSVPEDEKTIPFLR